MKYSRYLDPEKTARAYGRDLQCSPRHAENVAKAIKGMNVRKAEKLLEDIIALKKAIPFKTHNTERAHKKGIGPGGYPVKASKKILEVLKNAINNAEYKGLDPDNMFIAHVSTYKGRVTEGYMPRAMGRSSAWNERTTNVEIIIEER